MTLRSKRPVIESANQHQKQSAANHQLSTPSLIIFFSFLSMFLIIFLITSAPAFSETLIEENVQDTFSISQDGITIQKNIEYCGRLGVDLREKLAKQMSSHATVAPIPRTGLVIASTAKQSQTGDAQNTSPDTLPTQAQLDKFSSQLLSQWRKELPFSILINGKYVKLYPVALKIEKSQGIEDPLNLKLTLKTKNFKFSPGDYALYYTNQSLSRVTDELLSQVRENKAYSKLTLLRLCNVKINFSSAIKILSYSRGEVSPNDLQTIYGIYLNEPKDKVMLRFKISK